MWPFTRKPAAILVKEPSEAPATTIPDKPKTGRISHSWGTDIWSQLGAMLQGVVPNSDDLSIEDYRQMALGDDTIKSGLAYSNLSIMANFGVYRNPNKRAYAYVMEMLDRCETSIEDWGAEANTSEWAGYSVTERVYTYDGGKIWCKKLPVLDPALKFVIEQDRTSPRFGEVTGVVQDVSLFALNQEPIAVDRLILHATNSLFGNPYGSSECRSIYPPYLAKMAMFAQWGRTLERYGSPVAVGYGDSLNLEEESWLDQDVRVTKGDNILKMLQHLGEDALAVLPADVRLELLQAKVAVGNDFERHQNHCNKVILRGLMIPALLFEPTDIGSFALGEKHFEIHLASTINKTRKLQRSFLRYHIAPLLRWNFGPNVPVGEFTRPPLTKEERLALSSIFFSLTNAGYMTPTAREDSDFVRGTIGLNPMSDEGLANAVVQKTAGENLPQGVAPDGRGGTDPGQPSATPQTPGKPQGRPGGK